MSAVESKADIERNVAVAVIQRQELNISRGMPSMTALLGLLALAGYQNRDKLGELLKGVGGSNTRDLEASRMGAGLIWHQPGI
jgi:hypothetical protein